MRSTTGDRRRTYGRTLGLLGAVTLVLGQLVLTVAPVGAATAITCVEESPPSTCLDLSSVTGLPSGVDIQADGLPATWVHSTTQTVAKLAVTNDSASTVSADMSSLQFSADAGTSYVSADQDLSNLTIPANGSAPFTVTLPADVVTDPTVVTVIGEVTATNATPMTIVFGAAPVQVQPGDTVSLTAHVNPATVAGTVDFELDGSPVASVDMAPDGTASVDFVVPLDAAPGASVLDGGFTPSDSMQVVKLSTTASGFIVDVPTPPGSTTLNTGAVTGLPAGVAITLASDPTTWVFDGTNTRADLQVVNVGSTDREIDLSALRFSVDNNKTKFAGEDDLSDVSVPTGSNMSVAAVLPGDITQGATIAVTGAAHELGQITYGANTTGAVAPGTQLRFTVDVVPADVTGTVQFKVDGVAVGSPVALVKGHGSITWTVPAGAHGTKALSGTMVGGGSINFTITSDSFVVAIPPSCNASVLCIDASSVAGLPAGITFSSTTTPDKWLYANGETTATIKIADAGSYDRRFDLTALQFSPDDGATVATLNEDVTAVAVLKSGYVLFTVTWESDQRTATKLLITGDISQYVKASVKVSPTYVTAPKTVGAATTPSQVTLQATIAPADVVGAVIFQLDAKNITRPVAVSSTAGIYTTKWTVPGTTSRTTHHVGADFVPIDNLHAQEVLASPVAFVVKAPVVPIVLKAPTKPKVTSAKGLVTITFLGPKLASGIKITDYKLEVLPPKGKKWVLLKDGKSAKAVMKVKGLKKGWTYKARLSTITTKGTSKPGAVFGFKVK